MRLSHQQFRYFFYFFRDCALARFSLRENKANKLQTYVLLITIVTEQQGSERNTKVILHGTKHNPESVTDGGN